MSFRATIEQTLGRLASSVRHQEEREERAADVVALYAPYVLQRFAEVASGCHARHLPGEQGAILARRDDEGYRAVEYSTVGLHIIFHVVNGEAHLHWHAGDETGDRIITAATATAVIDATILDAVSAFVEGRVAAGAPVAVEI